MKRKVNLVGQNTLTVSLPTKWAKKIGLQKGDELHAEEDFHKLILSKDNSSKKLKEKTITYTDERLIRNNISRYYKIGYDVINFKLKDISLLKEIKKGVNNCIGADIVEWEDKQGKIKVFSDNEEINFSKYFTKLFHNITSSVDQLIEDLKNKKASYEVIMEYRENAWKLRDYIMRKTNIKQLTREEVISINITAHFTEKNTNIISNFYHKFTDFSKSEHTKSIKFAQEIKNHLENIHKLIYSKNRKLEEEIALRIRIRKTQKDILDALTNTKKDGPVLALIYTVCTQIEFIISSGLLMSENW